MKSRLKTRVLNWLAPRLPWDARCCYSQFGEDIALQVLLRYYGVSHGTYLDIGAYHPVRLSNTFGLYQAGWSGVTVEPNPAHRELFRAVRPRDTHLSVCVTPEPSAAPAEFFSFGPDSEYNTLSRRHAEEHARRSGETFVSLLLPAKTVNQILAEHFPKGVDVLCLDCEGVDEAILRSLDFSSYCPTAIVFEHDAVAFDEIPTLPVLQFLAKHNYSLYSKMGASFVARLPRHRAGRS